MKKKLIKNKSVREKVKCTVRVIPRDPSMNEIFGFAILATLSVICNARPRQADFILFLVKRIEIRVKILVKSGNFVKNIKILVNNRTVG